MDPMEGKSVRRRALPGKVRGGDMARPVRAWKTETP